MTTTSYFPVLESMQISPKLVYEFLETGIEAERAKYNAQRLLNDPEALTSFHNILQGERLLCFMRRGIRAGKLTAE